MAPVLTPLLRRAFAVVGASPLPTSAVVDGAADGPLADATRMHITRDTPSNNKQDPSTGVLDPHDISNVGFFVLFALLGLSFTDWEDYKTAVLRRRGPNGTLLSGATESTNLGGGSVYKDVADDGKTTITDSTGLSGITAGASDIAAREKREEKRAQRRQEREQRKKGKKRSDVSGGGGEYDEKQNRRRVEDGEVQDEEAEMKARNELRSYRHEKAARVGGLNKQSEGSSWDGSNATMSHTGTESELLPNKQSTPTSTPTKDKKRGVYSTADRNAEREAEKKRVEARRLRDEGRTHRRDFSFQRAKATDSLLSGSGTGSRSEMTSGGDSSELGTKSYHHPRPEISRAQREREREERRAKRGGYRRGRGDDEL
ncbi:hypothetical protein CRV24_008944 [Beauveria bassiana]|nr:hypothetical protein CRV24_008944 [Beauveria bassiana]